MTPQQALADVCRHFCADDQHDDACTALRATIEARPSNKCPSGCGRNEPCPDRWHDLRRLKGDV